MTPHHFRQFFVIAALTALLAPSLLAQNARPGGNSRGTTGVRAATTRSVSASTSTRSSGGQRQYRSNTELGDAVIQIDPETRSLVIVTDEDTHRELMTVIKTLDRPKPQVLIKVVFLEVTYNKGLDVGLDGGYTANMRNAQPASTGTRVTETTNTRNTDSGGTRNTTSTLTETLGDAATLAQTATVSSLFGLPPSTGAMVKLVSDDWNATLRLLATKGKVEVLSRPSIMARNNQEAVIVVGSEVPFITNSRTTDLGGTINTIQYDNVGIILRVTPFITSEGTVEMIVAPEISTLNRVDTVPIANNINAPTIDKRSAETVVVTPHGKTVVIGGLMETKKSESVEKIPILGDIPLIGAAFRHTIRDDRKRELLIFLTPYIVPDSNRNSAVSTAELSRAELSNQAIKEPEFEKFLDDLPLPTDGARLETQGPVATPIPAKKVITTKTTVTTAPAKPARR